MKAAGASLAGMGRGRLRLVMLAFFAALALPTAVLVFHAYGQLKWEAFHQYRGLAEEVSRRVDQRVSRLLAAEESRGFADYRFLVTQGPGSVAQRSALSAFPVRSDIPGLIGWFQVDSSGALTTPLLPDAPGPPQRYGLSAADTAARAALESRIQSILGANRLVSGRPALAAGARGAKQERLAKESDAPDAAGFAGAASAGEVGAEATSAVGFADVSSAGEATPAGERAAAPARTRARPAPAPGAAEDASAGGPSGAARAVALAGKTSAPDPAGAARTTAQTGIAPATASPGGVPAVARSDKAPATALADAAPTMALAEKSAAAESTGGAPAVARAGKAPATALADAAPAMALAEKSAAAESTDGAPAEARAGNAPATALADAAPAMALAEKISAAESTDAAVVVAPAGGARPGSPADAAPAAPPASNAPATALADAARRIAPADDASAAAPASTTPARARAKAARELAPADHAPTAASGSNAPATALADLAREMAPADDARAAPPASNAPAKALADLARELAPADDARAAAPASIATATALPDAKPAMASAVEAPATQRRGNAPATAPRDAAPAMASAAGAPPSPSDADRARDAVTTLDTTRVAPGRAGSAASAVAPAQESPPVAASPAMPPAEPQAQAAFDELKSAAKKSDRRRQAPAGALARVEELNLSSPYEIAAQARAKDARNERQRAQGEKLAALADLEQRAASEAIVAGALRASPESEPPVAKRGVVGAKAALAEQELAPIRTFESERDPFDVSLLDSGHFVLYRNVWRDGQRYVQGALIERAPLLSGLVASAFEDTALSRMSNLLVAWQGDVLAEFSGDTYRSLLGSGEDLAGALLYRTRLSAPLADLELVFSVRRLPVGPGATVIAWTAGVLALVLVTGVWLMYRLGVRQIALARQQQDFVSAVSHELRTPITSIRMYAEILREGWASEEKKRGYYAFIVQESERLSRLIANVLQLARMTRNEFSVQLQGIGVAVLLDGVRSQVASQVEHAGFELRMDCAGSAAATSVRVDPDAFSQCVINLVDNALKFSAGAARKVVELGCHLDGDGRVHVTVRDHGPGIPRDQMKKIFTLFYRSESELTRETVGTGIGLALVHQLVRAMHGQVDVVNAEPGARFTLIFPAVPGGVPPAAAAS